MFLKNMYGYVGGYYRWDCLQYKFIIAVENVKYVHEQRQINLRLLIFEF